MGKDPTTPLSATSRQKHCDPLPLDRARIERTHISVTPPLRVTPPMTPAEYAQCGGFVDGPGCAVEKNVHASRVVCH
ncbi:hypothetical protein NQZ68_033290 [Dissostichus eleginoides]|nr:hypothetical protein NQZ68_033290 [Dissostichus eleginoides]